MSATALDVSTLVFADPSLYATTQSQEDFARLNSSISFAWSLGQDITTLSVNSVLPGAHITGLIYTPDLDSSDPCFNASANYVPQNATRAANLPNPVNLIAVVPWISPQCTKKYLASAREDAAKCMIVYLTDPNYAGNPPTANSPAWDLGDGGQWRQQNSYPVYAIPPSSANLLLSESALYSGNMTSVPYGANLTAEYDSRDYVRLYMDLTTASTSGLPSLWVFLLIIVAVLLFIVGSISLMMHVIQRRRREILRRRVANGDVNREALGIKRMTVPQEMIDKMPMYTYEGYDEPNSLSTEPDGQNHISPDLAAAATSQKGPGLSSVDLSKRPPKRSHFDQSTCAICLDDFEHGESNVRQLPCEHIFHPECVDEFLRDNSSLCPLCKVSALPRGYCPTTITNAMVRRERLIRRLRPDAERAGSVDSQALERFSMPSRNPFSRSRRPVAASSDVELQRRDEGTTRNMTSAQPIPGDTAAGHTDASLDPGPAPSPNARQARREWARRRALAMLGQRPAPVAENPALTTRSRWRKLVDGVFPRSA